jgi:hypothetical protein
MKETALLQGEMIEKEYTYTENKKNVLLQNQRVKFNQTWYIFFFGEGNFKFVQIKGQVSFKGEIITKM